MAALLCVLVGLGALASGYVWFIEPRWFRLGHETIHVSKSFPGPLKVLHLSDTHFRRGSGAKLRFIQGLSAHEVDFVFATGDMIDNPAGIEYCVEALKALKPRYGTYVVLGGHDHYDITVLDNIHHLTHFRTSRRVSRENDKEQFVARLREIGVKVLVNENDRVKLDSGEIVIAGLDDPFFSFHDLDAAMKGVSDQDHTILLVHAPDVVDEVADRGVDVVFAGHTHGGQVRLPFIGALVTRCSLDTKYACGVFKRKHTSFHINRGIGAGRMTDFRFWCRPEATIVDIVPEEG